jgi:fatty acid desaturase
MASRRATPTARGRFSPRRRAPRAARVAVACLLGGFACLTVAEAGWAHAVGVVLLLGAFAAGVAAATPALLEDAQATRPDVRGAQLGYRERDMSSARGHRTDSLDQAPARGPRA